MTVHRTGVVLLILLLAACGEPPAEINSVLLSGGAYVRIENRQIPGETLDTTSLAALNNDYFSLEIRAAGDILPVGVEASPTLFMISNDQGQNEIGVFRLTNDSSSVFVLVGETLVGFFEIPGCDWNDPNIFTHVVVTYDGTRVSIYGNGALLGSKAISPDLNIGASDALIGAVWGTPNDVSTLDNFWYGAIDEVRLWTIVLPASEMQFRYENPDNLTVNYSADGLDDILGLWRFNVTRADGEMEPDGSGNGNVGVLNAGAGTLAFSPDGA